MSVMVECPACHRKQKLANKRCKACDLDLDKAKRAKKARFWVAWKEPDGTQRREPLKKETSLDEAHAADGKRKAQKIEEPRILKKCPEEKMTFQELTKWYLGLEKVKSLRSFSTIEIHLAHVNSFLGSKIVGKIIPADLENYQAARKSVGKSDKTVDNELTDAKTVVRKAFSNNLVSGETLKAFFGPVKNLLKKNANARDRILSLEEWSRLLEKSAPHVRAILNTAFYTGMRRSEVLALTWDKVDLKRRIISLEAVDTKDKEPRRIPICKELLQVLKEVPRALHDPHVFLYRGRPVKSIKTGLIRACKDAEIPYGRFLKGGFILHDMRHTFVTNMRKAGVPESVIMEFTGHSTREMFDRYNTIDLDDAHEAVGRLGDYLNRLGQSAEVDQDATSSNE